MRRAGDPLAAIEPDAHLEQRLHHMGARPAALRVWMDLGLDLNTTKLLTIPGVRGNSKGKQQAGSEDGPSQYRCSECNAIHAFVN